MKDIIESEIYQQHRIIKGSKLSNLSEHAKECAVITKGFMIGMVRWATERNYFYEMGEWYNLDEKICDTDQQLIEMYLDYVKDAERRASKNIFF